MMKREQWIENAGATNFGLAEGTHFVVGSGLRRLGRFG